MPDAINDQAGPLERTGLENSLSTRGVVSMRRQYVQ